MTPNNPAALALAEYCKTLQTFVMENSMLIEPRMTRDGVMYHINQSMPDENGEHIYIPQISRRAAPSEDRTTPRVTVAPSLQGCLVGYNTLSSLADTPVAKDKKGLRPYLGGLYIYEIAFDVALKPNEKLVFDAGISGECWLLPYDKEHVQYTGKCVGKIFPVSKSKLIWEHDRTEAIDLVLEIDKEAMCITHNLSLPKGFHHLKFVGNKAIVETRTLTEGEYISRKNNSASLLSHQEPTGSLLIKQW